MREKKVDSYEVKLYIGSQEDGKGRKFSEDELKAEIRKVQENYYVIPVRVTETQCLSHTTHSYSYVY